MESFGTRVQKGRMAETPKGAADIAAWIKAANPKAELILKSQIHAGGRGKGIFDTGFKGGVKICETPQEVETLAAQMIGHRLITKQTGPQGASSDTPPPSGPL
jgi:succinyl-CoA synthetase beta subunit